MQSAVSNVINIEREHGGLINTSARITFVKLFLLFLPFSQALTINLFFPLKLSEIFLILIILIEIVSKRIFTWKMNKTYLITLVFIGVVAFSVFINILCYYFNYYSYTLSADAIRINPVVDSVLKFIYVLLTAFALFITTNALREQPQIIKYYFMGAILSAVYAWYLFASGVLHIPPFLLPGMDRDNLQTMFNIVRCSTFKEGNYMGFYCLVSAITALYYKKPKLSVFFFITIITTFSSTSIVCAIIFMIIYFFNKYKKYKVKLISSMLTVTIVLLLLLKFSPEFNTIAYNKIFASEDDLENANDIYSRTDRLNTTLTGFTIFVHNPVLGVGLANYGQHYAHYNLIPEFDFGGKKIPNNIYIELLCECGLLGFIFFGYLLVLFYKIAKTKSHLLTAGLLASMVYFFAFPTFTMLFIWVFFAVIIA